MKNIKTQFYRSNSNLTYMHDICKPSRNTDFCRKLGNCIICLAMPVFVYTIHS